MNFGSLVCLNLAGFKWIQKRKCLFLPWSYTEAQDGGRSRSDCLDVAMHHGGRLLLLAWD